MRIHKKVTLFLALSFCSSSFANECTEMLSGSSCGSISKCSSVYSKCCQKLSASDNDKCKQKASAISEDLKSIIKELKGLDKFRKDLDKDVLKSLDEGTKFLSNSKTPETEKNDCKSQMSWGGRFHTCEEIVGSELHKMCCLPGDSGIAKDCVIEPGSDISLCGKDVFVKQKPVIPYGESPGPEVYENALDKANFNRTSDEVDLDNIKNQ